MGKKNGGRRPPVTEGDAGNGVYKGENVRDKGFGDAGNSSTVERSDEGNIQRREMRETAPQESNEARRETCFAIEKPQLWGGNDAVRLRAWDTSQPNGNEAMGDVTSPIASLCLCRSAVGRDPFPLKFA